MSKKQISWNIVANFLAFLIGLGINFFLTPYITESVGAAAYGFVPMSEYLASYMTVFTTAFSSMGNRFLTVSMERGEKKETIEYFNTLFFENLGLSLLSGIVFIVAFQLLPHFLKIPVELVSDVKLLIALSFLSVTIGIGTATFSSATFCLNRLDVKSMIKICGTVLRCVFLFVCYYFFPAKVLYLGLSNLALTLLDAVWNLIFFKKKMKDIPIRVTHFRFDKMKMLFRSGVWYSIDQLGYIMMVCLDLVIANVMIGAEQSGVLSIAKLVPNLLFSVVSIIVTSFAPQMVMDYATDEGKKRLLSTLDDSAKISGFFTIIPVAGFLAYGYDFFRIWVPGQDASLLIVLAILTMAGDAISYPIKAFDNLFVAANRVRPSAIASLTCGALNLLSMIVLLKTTSWGLFVVAGTSTVLLIGKDTLFKIPYLSKLLGVSPMRLWKYIFKYLLCGAFLIAFSLALKCLLPVTGWLMLIIDAVITALVSATFNFFVVFRKAERGELVKKWQRIIGHFFGRKRKKV